MSPRTYQVLVLITAPFVAVGGYLMGAPIAGWLASLDDEFATSLTLLGYLLGVLVAVLVWAAVLLPLRARAGHVPVSEELAQLRREGFVNAVSREQVELEERRHSADPAMRASFHARMALAGGLLSLVAGVTSWAFYEDGRALKLLLAAAVVCPVYTIYYFVQWLRHRLTRASPGYGGAPPTL